ncbi:MAG TPA: hypothetical protein VHW93_01730, partial [Acidimicrobiales bacterium]|nr:hypothetical protein [Acidimicrobiales bacterium]
EEAAGVEPAEDTTRRDRVGEDAADRTTVGSAAGDVDTEVDVSASGATGSVEEELVLVGAAGVDVGGALSCVGLVPAASTTAMVINTVATAADAASTLVRRDALPGPPEHGVRFRSARMVGRGSTCDSLVVAGAGGSREHAPTG